MFKKKGLFCLGFFSFFTLSLVPSIINAQGFQEGFGINEENVSAIQVPGSGENQDEKILDVVKLVINYVLGLLALITLILIIYGGLRVLFSPNDDAAYKKGFTILKNAAIGLAFIAFSWLLVSLIFYVLDVVTQ